MKKYINLSNFIKKIRQDEKFTNFLGFPPKDQLQTHASEGPIVLLIATNIRSDAILVQKDNIHSMPLRDLHYSDLENYVRQFQRALKSPRELNSIKRLLDCLLWLWKVAAWPILSQLGFGQTPGPGQHWPGVWWIPAGLMGALPIHAAGDHRSWQANGGNGGPYAVLDLVVSSYSSSLREIGYSRQHDQVLRNTDEKNRGTPDCPYFGHRASH